MTEALHFNSRELAAALESGNSEIHVPVYLRVANILDLSLYGQ